jgi:hypothetical protein
MSLSSTSSETNDAPTADQTGPTLWSTTGATEEWEASTARQTDPAR